MAASDLRETSVSAAGSLGTIVAGLVVIGNFAVTFAGLMAILAILLSSVAVFAALFCWELSYFGA